MDGDAIGGSINLVTKNSPYKRTNCRHCRNRLTTG